MKPTRKEFYDHVFSLDDYSNFTAPDAHAYFGLVKSFVETYGLQDTHCLEIGSGRGAFQDMVSNYIGADITSSVASYFHKPFCQCDAIELPFQDNAFGAVWTIDVHEHVPDPEKALKEIRRVLSPGGFLLFAPAWHTRSWFAKGYPVRPFRELSLKDGIIKAFIPLRDSPLFRYPKVLARRVIRYFAWKRKKGEMPFRYHKLTPSYDRFWMPDSDACNSMDPLDAILWFVSRGDKCLSPSNWLDWLLFREKGLIFRKAQY